MKLQSNFDFKTVRKAQSKITRGYNTAAKAVEKLTIPQEQKDQIEKILSDGFNSELKKLMSEGAPAATENGVDAAAKEKDAKAAGFV